MNSQGKTFSSPVLKMEIGLKSLYRNHLSYSVKTEEREMYMQLVSSHVTIKKRAQEVVNLKPCI